MLNAFSRVLLFTSSYTPLLLILGVKAAPTDLWIGAGLVTLGIAAGLVLLAILSWASRSVPPTPVHLAGSSSGAPETIAYLFTYVLPFIDATASSIADLFALAILFITIGLVFVNSNMILVNPLLAGAGFRLHKVETPGSQEYLVLSRRHLPPQAGSVIRVRRLGTLFGLEVTD